MALVKIELIKALIFIGTFACLIAWDTFENRKDQRRVENLIATIKKDMRDFHERLCAIEERKTMEKE